MIFKNLSNRVIENSYVSHLVWCVQHFFTLVPKLSFPPRIKYGAGLVKPGMTIKVKGLLTQYTRNGLKIGPPLFYGARLEG